MIQAVRHLLCVLSTLCVLPLTAAAQERATVFAAASLSGVLEQIIPDDAAVFSYGGSGTLARQLAAGAPADLIVLAHPQWMDWLRDTGRVAAQDVENIATNQLVVIGAADATPLTDPKDLIGQTEAGRIAIGHHKAVPAGQYAYEWLQRAGLWDGLAPQLIETQNVRAALALVQRGEVPMGVVYASDAAGAADVAILYRVPAGSHAPITYPAAPLSAAGRALLARLTAPQAQEILRRAGFGPAP